MNDRTCFICAGQCEPAIDLPRLPLTDTYGPKPAAAPEEGIDQQLLLCSRCGHGRLARILPPSTLYNANYSFRTSQSNSSSAGTEFFLRFLDDVAGVRRFRRVVDVGCNDLYLLRRLADRSDACIGIDPMLDGMKLGGEDSKITVCGQMFEDAPLDSLLSEPADLILARHTMEHIHHPAETIRRMFEYASDGALIVLEVPGFDALVQRRRYDQVFHQHIQYFSKASLHRLADECGATVVAMAENYHHWGAILVALRRGAGRAGSKPDPAPVCADVTTGFLQFAAAMRSVGNVLAKAGGSKYGYGASQMLPVLAYHLGTDLSELTAILDDDPAKDGWGYWNLPVPIKSSNESLDLSDATVLVTAVDNVVPILGRLLQNRPRHLVYPLPII